MSKLSKPILIVVATIVIIVVVGALTVSTANAAAPGDLLYPVDRSWEKVRLAVTLSDESKADYEMDLLNERMDELEKVQTDGTEEDVNEAIDNLEEQQDRVQDRIRELEDNDTGEGDLDRVRTRQETQAEEQIQQMEQVKEKLQTENKTQAAGDLDKVMEKYKADVNNSTGDNSDDTQDEDSTQTETEDTDSEQGNGNGR